MKRKEKTKAEEMRDIEAADEYPGVAINDGDRDKVNKTLVEDRTRQLNNNPRNDK